MLVPFVVVLGGFFIAVASLTAPLIHGYRLNGLKTGSPRSLGQQVLWNPPLLACPRRTQDSLLKQRVAQLGLAALTQSGQERIFGSISHVLLHLTALGLHRAGPC